MNKTIINPCLELKSQLLKVGAMVSRFEGNDYSAVKAWNNWLIEVEAILEKYHFSEAAEIAGLRAQTLVENTEPGQRVSKRKSSMQRSLRTVSAAQIAVLGVQKHLEDKLEGVRLIIKQIVLASRDAGFTFGADKGDDFTVYVDSLLTQLQQHEQLKSGINKAIAVIGKYDTLRVLAEEITME